MQKLNDDQEMNVLLLSSDIIVYLNQTEISANLKIPEIVNDFILSIQTSEKAGCNRALAQLFACIVSGDATFSLDIEEKVVENQEFIQIIEYCLQIDDEETFKLCSLLLYIGHIPIFSIL